MENQLNPNIPLEKYKGKLNWGAFLLGWIWALAHRAYLWAVLAFFIGGIINLILLFIGNDVALKNRQFKDEEEFVEVQKAWTKWGIIVWVGTVVLAILLAILLPLLIKMRRGM